MIHPHLQGRSRRFSNAIALGVLVAIGGTGGAFAQEVRASSTPTAALAIARSEMLRASQYPSGWKGYGPSTEFKGLSYFAGYPKHDAALLASCLQIPTTNIETNPVEIAGQRYNGQRSNLAVSENVEVFRSAAIAAIDAQAAGNPRTPTCNTHLPGSQTGTINVSGTAVDVTKATIVVRPIGTYGNNSADLEISVHETIPKYKQSFIAYSDLVYIQKGRSEAVLFFSNNNAQVPSAFIAGLAQAAANRLAPS